MIVSVEKDNQQLASITSFNKALLGSVNEVEKVIIGLPFPITQADIIVALRENKSRLHIEGAKVYFKSDHEMRFNHPGMKI